MGRFANYIRRNAGWIGIIGLPFFLYMGACSLQRIYNGGNAAILYNKLLENERRIERIERQGYLPGSKEEAEVDSLRAVNEKLEEYVKKYEKAALSCFPWDWVPRFTLEGEK